MTLHKFRLLDARAQVAIAFMRGTRLAHRWEDEGKVVLYHMLDETNARGFFVEVSHNKANYRAVVLRSFSSAVPLADYVRGVRLPQGW